MAAKRYIAQVPFVDGDRRIEVGGIVELEDDVAQQHAGRVDLVRDGEPAAAPGVITTLPLPAVPARVAGE